MKTIIEHFFLVLDPDPEDTVGQMKGFKIVRIDAIDTHTNQKIGFIKISFIPKERWDEIFENDILKFASLFKGWSFDEKTLNGIEKYCCQYPYKDKLTREEAERLTLQRFYGCRKDTKRYHVNKPMVDYIFVYEDMRRQRIGTALYMEGARWCQQNNMKLYASGIQSDEAKSCWQHLAKLDNCEVRRKMCVYGGRRISRRILTVSEKS